MEIKVLIFKQHEYICIQIPKESILKDSKVMNEFTMRQGTMSVHKIICTSIH